MAGGEPRGQVGSGHGGIIHSSMISVDFDTSYIIRFLFLLPAGNYRMYECTIDLDIGVTHEVNIRS